MKEYIIRRLIWLVPTLLAAMTLVFIILSMLPGDPVSIILGAEGVKANPELYEATRAELGLDRPLLVRYLMWMKDAFTGDFGTSFFTGEDVFREVNLRMPVTGVLLIMAMIITLIIAVPIGIFSALYQDKWPDYVLRIFALAGLSMPNFWFAIMIILILLTVWRWYPPIEYAVLWRDPWTVLQQLIFPALVLGYRPSSTAARIIRSSMLEVLREDYIRTARAKGLPERRVILRHALGNALLPAVTFFALEAVLLVGGAVVIEFIFGIPGIGSLLVQGVWRRDLPIVQGVMLMILGFVLLLNLAVDVLYARLDPRIRYGKV